jgi:HSP20 family protein
VPFFADDFFRPWNEWFGNGFGKTVTFPSVNIIEGKNNFKVKLAAPGLKKNDFKIDWSGELITISAETEMKKDEKEENFTREEYNYSSFSRTFTLPENIVKEKITANYENGELELTLPKKEAGKTEPQKHITVN